MEIGTKKATGKKRKLSTVVMVPPDKSPFIYLRSQRNRPILCYENKRFRKERTLKNGREYWRCLQLRCRGRLIIHDATIVKSKMHDAHCTHDEMHADEDTTDFII